MTTHNPMQITAEDAAAARKAQALLPVCVAARMEFRYSVDGEMSQRPSQRHETLAFLFPPGVAESEIDARLFEALTALGSEFDATNPRSALRMPWRGIDLPPAHVAVIDPRMSGFDRHLERVASDEEALSRCARFAVEIGERVCEASGAVGWRRPEDYPSARFVTEGLRMAFEDLNALREALETRRDIDAHLHHAGREPTSAPPSPSRLAL